MKNFSLTILSLIAVAFFLQACGGSETKTVETNDAGTTAEAAPTAVTYNVNTQTSTANWSGGNVVGKVHSGTINIASGSFNVEAGNITAGNVAMDMTSIQAIDDGVPNDKLTGHLKADDFFGVEAHPQATFEITAVEAATADSSATHHISGNLTIRGISKEITIPANVSMSDAGLSATSSFSFNRADFEVKYGSGAFFEGLGDKMIKDEVALALNIVAAPAASGTK